MNEEITDVKPPMGFPHITDLAGSEATILQVANSQGDILGYATLNDIDAYIEQKVSETVHSFSQKQIFQDVTINGTFDGNNVVNQSKLNGALTRLLPKTMVESDGIIVMQHIGQQFVNMGVTGDLNHLYLLHVIDKGDSSRRLSLIIDFQMSISDAYTILAQSGLVFYATNIIGTISISNGTGQGLLFYATLLD